MGKNKKCSMAVERETAERSLLSTACCNLIRKSRRNLKCDALLFYNRNNQSILFEIALIEIANSIFSRQINTTSGRRDAFLKRLNAFLIRFLTHCMSSAPLPAFEYPYNTDTQTHTCFWRSSCVLLLLLSLDCILYVEHVRYNAEKL